MRVVDRAGFLALPAGTVYAKIPQKWIVGDICVKAGNCGDNDWFYESFDWVDAGDSNEAVRRLDEMADSGASYPVQKGAGRDGLFDPDDLFLIYEPDDVAYIAGRLTGAISADD